MGCFDSESFITSIVLTIAKALCGLFCAPVYDDIRTTVEVVRNPQLLYDDSEYLRPLLTDINAMSSSEVIDSWINDAEKIVDQIDRLRLQERDHQSSCLYGTGNACSRCNLHRNIKKMIARGEIIKRSTTTLRPQTVEHIPNVPAIEDGTTAGRNLGRVMDMLKGENVWCIGVWGPGGVGKTTLAKALNNKLERDSPFSLVKLIELKANDGQNEVQEAIAKKLGLDMGEGIEDRIRNTLQKKKFLLILDNVWSESICLSSIGIPERQDGSKIILTTRSKRVCTKIEAKEIEMGYLDEEEAWQLFAEKAGGVVNDEKIKPLARKVCKECGNLPLALVVVGSAMKGETKIVVWQNAINALRNSVPIDVNMEKEVYNPLKLSYDSLDDTLKSCFLYCSLYPEGSSIRQNELVECWLAENLIDEGLLYTVAYGAGVGLIKKLNESCLLQGDLTIPEPTVKMHDVVRDVARWIGKSTKKSVAFSGYGISLSPTFTLREEFKNFLWISFVDNKEIVLPEREKDYSSVTTLLIRSSGSYREKSHVSISTEFLKGFRAIRALNMEGVQSFAASQLQLEVLRAFILRDCSNIEEVPTANDLKILDLSSCGICKLPRGMKKLSNLKVLRLCEAKSLRSVDADIIRNLNFLEVLDMSNCGYEWPVRKRSELEDRATLQDFAGLQWLREVYLQLAEADGTYEECSWMERLESFHLAYRGTALADDISEKSCQISILKQQHRASGRTAVRENNRRIFVIHEGSDDMKVGSFILYAQELCLYVCRNVNAIFANFSSIDQSNSKLKRLEISFSIFGTSSTAVVPKFSVLLNAEELIIRRCEAQCRDTFLNQITGALGTNFSKLSSLTIERWPKAVFTSDNLHIVLPKLEELHIYYTALRVAFDCGPQEIHAIAPNLRTLEVVYIHQMESLCKCEPNEQWTSLEILKVSTCPDLKKLPYMPSIKEIRGEQGWWNRVKWDSEEIKSFMNQHFKPW